MSKCVHGSMSMVTIMTDWMYDCERLIYAPLEHWQWLFASTLAADMWTEDYYQLLSIIGDDDY
jgi:hypothetical protein